MLVEGVKIPRETQCAPTARWKRLQLSRELPISTFLEESSSVKAPHTQFTLLFISRQALRACLSPRLPAHGEGSKAAHRRLLPASGLTVGEGWDLQERL